MVGRASTLWPPTRTTHPIFFLEPPGSNIIVVWFSEFNYLGELFSFLLLGCLMPHLIIRYIDIQKRFEVQTQPELGTTQLSQRLKDFCQKGTRVEDFLEEFLSCLRLNVRRIYELQWNPYFQWAVIFPLPWKEWFLKLLDCCQQQNVVNKGGDNAFVWSQLKVLVNPIGTNHTTDIKLWQTVENKLSIFFKFPIPGNIYMSWFDVVGVLVLFLWEVWYYFHLLNWLLNRPAFKDKWTWPLSSLQQIPCI